MSWIYYCVVHLHAYAHKWPLDVRNFDLSSSLFLPILILNWPGLNRKFSEVLRESIWSVFLHCHILIYSKEHSWNLWIYPVIFFKLSLWSQGPNYTLYWFWQENRKNIGGHKRDKLCIREFVLLMWQQFSTDKGKRQ